MSVRLIFIISLIEDLPIREIDFFLALPHADLDFPIFMEFPVGFSVQEEHCCEYVIQLKKSIYRFKLSGINWFQKLSQGLNNRGFVQSKVDPCVFISSDITVLTVPAKSEH